jgi:hypothetical protein
MVYGLLIVLVSSIYMNYHLYKENLGYKVKIGIDYQVTIAQTLFHLREDDVDFWIKTLQEENGDILLEKHIGNLEAIAQHYHDMSGKIMIIGTQINYISKHYQELIKNVDEEKDYPEIKEALKKHIAFVL